MDTHDLTITGVQPSNAVKIQTTCYCFHPGIFWWNPRFNYRGCPDLNLRQISQSESEALVTHKVTGENDEDKGRVSVLYSTESPRRNFSNFFLQTTNDIINFCSMRMFFIWENIF